MTNLERYQLHHNDIIYPFCSPDDDQSAQIAADKVLKSYDMV